MFVGQSLECLSLVDTKLVVDTKPVVCAAFGQHVKYLCCHTARFNYQGEDFCDPNTAQCFYSTHGISACNRFKASAVQGPREDKDLRKEELDLAV